MPGTQPGTFIVSSTLTTRYIGKCAPCVRPVAATINTGTDHERVECPNCGALIDAQRIYGTVNRMQCDPRCESATGPICSCACGGVNHSGSWVGKGEILADELKAYRDRLAQVEAKREARASVERKRARNLFDEWALEHKPLADHLMEVRVSDLGGFMYDMAWTVQHDHKPLSDRQTEAAERIMAQDQERERRKAEEKANAKPCPTGKAIVVRGTVVHTKLVDNDYAYHAEACTSKMLVLGDGWKVWATIPRAIDDVNLTTEGNLGGLKGKVVEFTADVNVKGDDVSFGIAKRPRAAKIL